LAVVPGVPSRHPFLFHPCRFRNAQSTGVPISGLHCPPVWGFVGSRKYVDVDRVVYGHGRQDNRSRPDDKRLRTVLLLRSADGLPHVVNGGGTDGNVRE